MKIIGVLWLAALGAVSASAHQGHGMAGGHGHGEDLWFLAALAVAALVALGLFGKGK